MSRKNEPNGRTGVSILANKEAVREFKKKLIIEAAWKLFLDRPYEEITVQDIADAAGIGKATLYQYFSSKEAIIFGIMLRSAQELNEAAESCCAKYEDARQAFEYLIHHIYQVYLKNNRLFLAFLGLKLQGGFKPEWLEEVRAERERKFDILSRLLDRGMDQGVFIQADSRRLARVLNNILRGFSLEHLEAPPEGGSPGKEVDSSLILSVLFNGILTDGGGEKSGHRTENNRGRPSG